MGSEWPLALAYIVCLYKSYGLHTSEKDLRNLES